MALIVNDSSGYITEKWMMDLLILQPTLSEDLSDILGEVYSFLPSDYLVDQICILGLDVSSRLYTLMSDIVQSWAAYTEISLLKSFLT